MMINRRDIVVFVSGKYTGKDVLGTVNNISLAKNAAVKLVRAGYTVLTPHLNTMLFDEVISRYEVGYEDYMQSTIELMKRCDIVYFMPNWSKSVGAQKERQIAVELNMKCSNDIESLMQGYVIWEPNNK